MNLQGVLTSGAAELGVALDANSVDMLWRFKAFLKEYNEKVNLTAIKDDESIVVKHFLDCLTVLPHLVGGRAIDIGTGAGLPGMVVAICRPDMQLTLLDARAKKVKFIEEAVKLLDLTNVTPIHGRAEDVVKLISVFDNAVSRAVGQLDVLAGWCLPFVKQGGSFIAMKGPNYASELDAASPTIKRLGGKVADIVTLTLPKTDIERNLIIITKSDKR